MTYGITGGSGFIGSALQQRLGKKVKIINFDIRDKKVNDVRHFERLKKTIRGVDGVIHFAAISRPKWGYEDPVECLTTNIIGTMNVLEAVRQINPQAWVILGSSREVFGDVKKFPATEKSERQGLNAYAVSKITGEDLLRQYAMNYGLRCLTIRFCGVYTGSRDISDRVIPRFIGLALRGEPITIEGGGKRGFDFTYISDAIDGVVRAVHYIARRPASFYDDITFAADASVSLLDLAHMIKKFARSTSEIVHVPDRIYDQRRGFTGSYKKANRLLGWKPKVSLESGLKKSIKELKT